MHNPTLSFQGHTPQLGEGCYIAPNASVIGLVELGDHANIWFNTVVRGDINKILIGANTNIQDLSMLHVIEDRPLIIGACVSVGHHAVLHACTVEDHCLIGMGAIILDGAHIGHHSVVAAGSVVPPGKKYPPGSMIMGSPATLKRELSSAEQKSYGEHYLSYITNKNLFLADCN